MDNIKDRQFYWEVKQFFNGKPENNVPPQPKPSLKDAVSGVLKENNPYKQTNFSNNQTSVNAAQNAIQGLGAMDAANKPSCVAYTKNAIKNPFNLNEGFWDAPSMAAPGALEVEDRRRQARANSTQQNFGSPTAPKTAAQQQLERDAASGKPGTQRQAYYSSAPLVQDSIDKYKEQNTAQPPVNTDNRSFFQKAADQANNPEKYDLGVVGKLSANVANFFGGFGPTNKPREATGTASTDKSGNTVFNPTPVQTQTPKPASAPAPVQGQSQAPNAQTKAPVQGQPQSVPAKNQPTTTSTTPYTRQYVSSEPEGQPKRGPGGGIIAPPVALDKASENPKAYEGMDDRRALGQVPMGGEVVGPNGIQKQNSTVSPYVQSLQNAIRQSAPQNNQFTPSGGQYRNRNRGSSNMGMATRPNRPEAMTLQSAMAQQNQQATRNTLGQMGAVQGTSNSSSGFQGSVLPPAGQLTSMGTQKENEFKYARGSRLA
jgi:hypothetical protein